MSAECDVCGTDLVGSQYDERGLFCQRCDLQAQVGERDRQIATLAEALKECQRLAVERIKTADDAVKKDVYAADALMGIATIARHTLADLPAAAKEIDPALARISHPAHTVVHGERAEKLATRYKRIMEAEGHDGRKGHALKFGMCVWCDCWHIADAALREMEGK